MDTSNNERLRVFVDYLKENSVVYNDTDFSARIGKGRSYVSEALSGRRTITSMFVDSIVETFPSLNRDWLLTGEGEMLVTSPPTAADVTTVEPTAADEGGYMVPLLPVFAYGGALSGFGDEVELQGCERIIVPIRGVDFAITIYGDSMEPEYPNGSVVAIKKINEHAFIEWGKVYVLDTCNGGVIKRITKGADIDHITCESINPRYQPFEVALRDIYGMYRVEMLMCRK